MFQYATALEFAVRQSKVLMLDISSFNLGKTGFTNSAIIKYRRTFTKEYRCFSPVPTRLPPA